MEGAPIFCCKNLALIGFINANSDVLVWSAVVAGLEATLLSMTRLPFSCGSTLASLFLRVKYLNQSRQYDGVPFHRRGAGPMNTLSLLLPSGPMWTLLILISASEMFYMVRAQYCSPGSGLPGPVRVLLVYGSSTGSSAYEWDVQAKLRATGAFETVDLFNANATVPTLSKLLAYHAVLVWSNPGFYSPIQIGNVLADYWDSGGSVVPAMMTIVFSNLRGRFGNLSNGYMLIDGSAGNNGTAAALGDVLEPESPILTGVSAISAIQSWRSMGAITNGGVVVARWGSSQPLVVRGLREGRNLVALNMFPASSSVSSAWWTGDGAALMRNSLLFSVCKHCDPGKYG